MHGLKVLDLTQVVAGPCTGRILVEYGADVIKINNPHPESLTAAVSLSGRPTDPGNQQHEHLNRGKQSLLLDLRTPSGLQVFGKLLDQTDVVMQNFAAKFKGWRFAFLMQGRLPVLTAKSDHAISNGGLRCRLYVGVC